MTLELGAALLVLYGETGVLGEPNLMCPKSFVIKNKISRGYRSLSLTYSSSTSRNGSNSFLCERLLEAAFSIQE